MEIILKPCPFCGSANIESEWMNDYCYVACNRCMTTGPAARVDGKKNAATTEVTRKLAEAAWNWRSKNGGKPQLPARPHQEPVAIPNGPISGEVARLGVQCKILAQRAGSGSEEIMGNHLLWLAGWIQCLEGAMYFGGSER